MFMNRGNKRRKQIESLEQRNPFVQQKSSNPDIFHVGLRLSDGKTIVTVRIILPDEFPAQKPLMQIRSGDTKLRHEWLDENQNLAYCPELENWRGNSSDVGIVLQNIMHYFTQRPPQIVRTNLPGGSQQVTGPSSAPYAGTQQRAGAAASSGFRSTYTPATGTPINRVYTPRHESDSRTFPNNNIWNSTDQESSRAPPSYSQYGHQRNTSSFPVETVSRGKRQNDRSSRIQLPDIPDDFPELDKKLIAELQVFEFDDKLREAFLIKQKPVENFRELDKSCTRESLKIVEDNLKLEKKINDLMKERDEKRESANRLRAEAEALSKQMEEIKGRFRPEAIARRLTMKAKELDKETEQYASDFVSQSQPAEADQKEAINKFMDEFMQKREKYHEVSAKAELVDQKGFVDFRSSNGSTEGIDSGLGVASTNGTVFI
eukprot:gb/GECG01012354.1/.p1 GENE.gb/GECG01012354.1/~~gb/GECG01012354.1/.p1  ORF type:complete len:432 (+),score=69.98 gb/GECG01012354.1/:1-1296(+)